MVMGVSPLTAHTPIVWDSSVTSLPQSHPVPIDASAPTHRKPPAPPRPSTDTAPAHTTRRASKRHRGKRVDGPNTVHIKISPVMVDVRGVLDEDDGTIADVTLTGDPVADPCEAVYHTCDASVIREGLQCPMGQLASRWLSVGRDTPGVDGIVCLEAAGMAGRASGDAAECEVALAERLAELGSPAEAVSVAVTTCGHASPHTDAHLRAALLVADILANTPESLPSLSLLSTVRDPPFKLENGSVLHWVCTAARHHPDSVIAQSRCGMEGVRVGNLSVGVAALEQVCV